MENTKQWMPVAGYNGLYEVASCGSIRSLAGRRKGVSMLKPGRNSAGYLGVILVGQGKRKWRSIHRIVATAFVANPCAYPFVNHIDCNKENNNASNLEWCTAKQNALHASRNGRIRSGAEHPKARGVKVFRDGILIGTYATITQASKELGVPYPSLCNGRSYAYTTEPLI